MCAHHALLGRQEALSRRSPTRTVAIPARCSSVITGLERDCHAELVGFAAPIGRLGAVLRITDKATGRAATSVVPVELPARIEAAAGTAEMTIPASDVIARELRVETDGVRLTVSPPAGALLGDLLTADFQGASAHRQALVLNTALRGGAVATA
jgi:hypothetical protein